MSDGWHYHATLSCEHDVVFDMDTNLFIDSITTDPEVDVIVRMTCDVCGQREQSVSLAVNTGRMANCPACTPVGLI